MRITLVHWGQREDSLSSQFGDCVAILLLVELIDCPELDAQINDFMGDGVKNKRAAAIGCAPVDFE